MHHGSWWDVCAVYGLERRARAEEFNDRMLAITNAVAKAWGEKKNG